MTSPKSTRPRTETISQEDVGDPIAFIRHDHDRQCQICDRLEDMFNNEDELSLMKSAKLIRTFLLNDLHRHIEDEEIDLFPILARRCKDQAILDDILAQLASEHDLDKELVDVIVKELKAIEKSRAVGNSARFLMNVRAFTETQRRHLFWENRVVLPLAERYLTKEDRLTLSRSMAARRHGAPSPSPASGA